MKTICTIFILNFLSRIIVFGIPRQNNGMISLFVLLHPPIGFKNIFYILIIPTIISFQIIHHGMRHFIVLYENENVTHRKRDIHARSFNHPREIFIDNPQRDNYLKQQWDLLTILHIIYLRSFLLMCIWFMESLKFQ